MEKKRPSMPRHIVFRVECVIGGQTIPLEQMKGVTIRSDVINQVYQKKVAAYTV